MVHGPYRIDEWPRRTVMLVIHTALVAVIRGEPLVLDSSALRLAVEVANSFLFLIVHILVRKIAQDWLVHFVAFVQLLRIRISFEVAYLLIIRYNDAFSFELRRPFHRHILSCAMHLQLLRRVYLRTHLRLYVCFVIYRVAQVSNLIGALD